MSAEGAAPKQLFFRRRSGVRGATRRARAVLRAQQPVQAPREGGLADPRQRGRPVARRQGAPERDRSNCPMARSSTRNLIAIRPPRRVLRSIISGPRFGSSRHRWATRLSRPTLRAMRRPEAVQVPAVAVNSEPRYHDRSHSRPEIRDDTGYRAPDLWHRSESIPTIRLGGPRTGELPLEDTISNFPALGH